MKLHFWQLACALGLWLLACACPAGEPVRLALLSPDDSERARQLVDLAIAEASRLPDVEVLERGAAWERLQEEALTQLGLVSEDTAMTLGQRLGVEVFAFLETSPESHDAMGLVAFDVHSGMRLWDVTLPPGPLEEQLNQVLMGLQSALRKKQYLADGVWALCFASVRNVDLPRMEDSVLDGMARLVERRLNTADNLVVLERRRLEWLNEEQVDMVSGVRERIRGAVVIADVEFARDSIGNKTNMHIRLTSSQGKPIGTLDLPAHLADVVGTADNLAEGICSLVNGGCLSSTVDPEREARHFAREAEHALGHLQHEAALRAAEAAYALAPTNASMAGLLVKILFTSARASMEQKLPANVTKEQVREHRLVALNRAQRAMQIIFLHLQNFVPPKDLLKRNGHPIINIHAESGITYFLYYAFLDGTSRDPVLRGLLEDLQAQAQNMFKKEYRAYRAAVTRNVAFRGLTVWLTNVPFSYGRVCLPTAAAWVDYEIDLLEPWLELARQYRLYNDMYASPNRLLLGIQSSPKQFWLSSRFLLDGIPGCGWTLGPAEFERLEPLFDEMGQHPNPIIRLYGWRGRLWVQQQRPPLNAPELMARYQEILEAAWKILDEELPRDNRGYRLMIYRGLLDVIQLLPERTQQVREQQVLLAWMLKLGEISPEVLDSVTGWVQAGVDPSTARLALQQVRQGLEEQSLNILWGREGTVQSKLCEIKQALGKPSDPVTEAPPTLPARTLLDRTLLPGLERISPPRIAGREAWVAALEKQRDSADLHLSIYRLDLETGALHRETRAPVRFAKDRYSPSLIRPPSRGDGFWAVPTARHGAVILFDDARPPLILTETNGLPSSFVHSVLAVGTQIYLGLGKPQRAGYLVAYDVETGKLATLSSSLRKAGPSPLDNVTPPYVVELLEWDAPRKRLLFLVHFGRMFSQSRHRSRGLWAYSPGDSSWTFLQEFYRNIPRGRRLANGHLFLDSTTAAALFDTVQDTGEMLYSTFPASIGPGLTPSTSRMALDRYATGPFALLADELWTTHPFSRISRDGRQQTYYTLPDTVNPPSRSESLWLESIGPGALLYGCPQALWRIEVPDLP